MGKLTGSHTLCSCILKRPGNTCTLGTQGNPNGGIQLCLALRPDATAWSLWLQRQARGPVGRGQLPGLGLWP